MQYFDFDIIKKERFVLPAVKVNLMTNDWRPGSRSQTHVRSYATKFWHVQAFATKTWHFQTFATMMIRAKVFKRLMDLLNNYKGAIV